MDLFRILAVALVVLISGCTTPGDVRMKSPALDLNSKKSSKDVVGCIADGLEKASPTAQVYSRPITNGFTVWEEVKAMLLSPRNETLLVVDIIDIPSGSNTKLYSNVASWKEKEIRVVISDCQGQLSSR